MIKSDKLLKSDLFLIKHKNLNFEGQDIFKKVQKYFFLIPYKIYDMGVYWQKIILQKISKKWALLNDIIGIFLIYKVFKVFSDYIILLLISKKISAA